MKREYLDKLYSKLHIVKLELEARQKIKDFDGECTAGIRLAVKDQLQEQHLMIVELIDDYLTDHGSKS